jgi:magnesium chelatase family protein
VCGDAEIVRYRSRLSGALADRIDMHVTLPPVAPALLEGAHDGESSLAIRARVERSRDVQRCRFADVAGVSSNAGVSGRWLLSNGGIEREARALLTGAMESLNLSARAYHRVLRVARTIADIEQKDAVSALHVGEALRYRPR